MAPDQQEHDPQELFTQEDLDLALGEIQNSNGINGSGSEALPWCGFENSPNTTFPHALGTNAPLPAQPLFSLPPLGSDLTNQEGFDTASLVGLIDHDFTGNLAGAGGADLVFPSDIPALGFQGSQAMQMQSSQNPAQGLVGVPSFHPVSLPELQYSHQTLQAVHGAAKVGPLPQELVANSTQIPFTSANTQFPLIPAPQMPYLSQPNHVSSARAKRTRSPSPKGVSPDCFQLSFYNPHQKKAKRSPYSKATCLRCQDQKKKCSGTFPCKNCSELFERGLKASKKRKDTAILLWTACFDSDIREMNIFGTFADDAVFDLAVREWPTYVQSSVAKDFHDAGRLVISPPAGNPQFSPSHSRNSPRLPRSNNICFDSEHYFILPWMFATIQLDPNPSRGSRETRIFSLENKLASAKVMFERIFLLLSKLKVRSTEDDRKALYLCLTVITIVASKKPVWQRLGFNSTPDLDNGLIERNESKEAHFHDYVNYLRNRLVSVFQHGDHQWPWIAQSIHSLAKIDPKQQTSDARDTITSHDKATLIFQYQAHEMPTMHLQKENSRYFQVGGTFEWQITVPWGGYEQWKQVLPPGAGDAANRSRHNMNISVAPSGYIYSSGDVVLASGWMHRWFDEINTSLQSSLGPTWEISSGWLQVTEVSRIECDRCGERFKLEGGYHCESCNNGDYDVCEDCFVAGQGCKEGSHVLKQWRVDKRSWGQCFLVTVPVPHASQDDSTRIMPSTA